MLYYSDEARQSHISNIDRLKRILVTIPGNILNIYDSADLIKYLSDYQKQIIKEVKENK